MGLEDSYRKAKRKINKRDAALAKKGTTAGQDAAKKRSEAKSAAQASGRAAAFHGATDQVSNRAKGMTTPRSEYQDSQSGKKPSAGEASLF